MTDVKQLPDNLEQLEQLTEFKRVYKKYTADQLETQLTDAGVNHLSADNKADLVWRLLDHQGFDFDAAIAAELAPTNNEVGTDENAQAVQDDISNGYGTQVDGEENTDTSADSANTDDSEKSDEVVDVADNDAPSDIGNGDDASANEVNQSAKTDSNPAVDGSAPDNKTTSEAPVSEAEFVEVKNNGGFNMLEPATSTLVKAGKTTKIYINGYATKEQVLRNIAQYNQTRGKKLTVTN